MKPFAYTFAVVDGELLGVPVPEHELRITRDGQTQVFLLTDDQLDALAKAVTDRIIAREFYPQEHSVADPEGA